MDAAKRIAEWRELSPAQWVSLANRLLPPIATAVLVVATAYGLARLTWQIVPGARLDAPAPEVAAPLQSGGASADDYGSLLDSHLFGKAELKTAPIADTPVDAPDTTLNLELTGTQASGDSRRGQAIIASGRGREKAYSVGDAIEGTNGVKLHAVYPDRVILNRNGQLETLRLPKAKAGQAAAAIGRAAPASAPPDEGQPSVRQIISNNATKISQVIRLAPHIEGGKMVGFRVSPGPDRKAFEALGLQPGDVVTDVNGTAVNNPAKGLKVYQALGTSTVANVTILRDGTPQVIAIDTSRLKNVAKNLQ